MKKNSKKVFSLILAITMFLSLTITAQAVSFSPTLSSRKMTIQEIEKFNSLFDGVNPYILENLEAEKLAKDKEANATRSGVLPNGLKYTVRPMTDEEKNKTLSPEPRSYSWSGNVLVPISNPSGSNGAQLGHDFIIAPDTIAVISVDNLPATTMPTVNIGAAATNGMWTDWISNIGPNSIIELSPGEDYAGYSYRVKVSTYESNSRMAGFGISTK